MHARLRAELLLRRLGWPPAVGLALACAGLAVLLAWLPAQEKRLGRMEAEYRRVLAQIAAPAAPSAARESSTLLAERQAAFSSTLAPRAKMPDLVKTVFAEAQKAGLSLAQAEYRLGEDKAGGYASYQMVLPVKGPYLKLREFIDGVLAEAPAAALEEISFKRDSIGAPAAEARLRFVFYLREAAP